MKHPIHLSQNLSVKMLADINKLPDDLKREHKKRSFKLRCLRGDVKEWLFLNKPEDEQKEA